MSEVLFTQYRQLFKKTEINSNLFFIYGDSYLTDIVRKDLVEHIVPENNNGFSVEKYDGHFKSVNEICEIVFTYSFFSDKKVVVYENPPFFNKTESLEKAGEKIKKEFSNNRIDLAAAALMRKVSSSKNLFSDKWKDKIIKDFFPNETELEWLEAVIEHAAEKNIKPGGDDDESSFFIDFADKEFPESNYLIVVAEKADKKKKIYKKIKEKGIIIDCGLPSGIRKKDKEDRENIAKKVINDELKKLKSNKYIESSAIGLLLEYSGDDLRTLVKNLNQVVTYSSDKDFIEGSDIEKILERTREDPVFVFTGAVAEKNIKKALFYMHSLIDSGYYPLQVFAALSNQITKLGVALNFLTSPFSVSFTPNMNYSLFTKNVVPEISAYDEDIKNKADLFETGKLKKDYYVLGGKKNYYPVYLLFKNASLFKIKDIQKAFILLEEADTGIKSGQDPVGVLENFLFQFLLM